MAALALALGAGWLWLRDSFLVSADQVSIHGANGAEGVAIQGALSDAGHRMTTLDVDYRALMAAVRDYPVVRDVRVRTHFPHGLTIDVIERPPVAVLSAGGSRIAVSADGLLLRGLAPTGGTPLIALRSVPGGARLNGSRAQAVLAMLAAAPAALRHHIERGYAGAKGLVAIVRHGPLLYFGDGSRLHAKWAAAARVLADPTSSAAKYIDVRLPERPVAAVPGAQALFARAQAAVRAGTSGQQSTSAGSPDAGAGISAPAADSGSASGSGSSAGTGAGTATGAGSASSSAGGAGAPATP